MLRPGVVGMRESMAIRLQSCMRSSTSLLPSTPPHTPTHPHTDLAKAYADGVGPVRRPRREDPYPTLQEGRGDLSGKGVTAAVRAYASVSPRVLPVGVQVERPENPPDCFFFFVRRVFRFFNVYILISSQW